MQAQGFTGSGANLTGIPTSALTGTLATSRLEGTISDDQLASGSLFAKLNADQNFQGTVSANAFVGRGNVQAASAAVSGNLTVGGTVSGNGSGLTNLDASKLTGKVAIANLPVGTDANSVAAGNHTHTSLLGEGLDNPATSCAQLKQQRSTAPSGIYWIRPTGAAAPFRVQCEMAVDGGGWTMVGSLVNDDGVYSWTQFASEANNIRTWRNAMPFGEIELFKTADYKSSAYGLVAGTDLMVMDDTNAWARFAGVLGTASAPRTLPARLNQQTSCMTTTILAPGSGQIASSNAVAQATMFFALYGGDPNNGNLCPLNFGADSTDAAVLTMGGNGCASTGLGYVGYYTGSVHTDQDTTFCLAQPPTLTGSCGNWNSTAQVNFSGGCRANVLYVR